MMKSSLGPYIRLLSLAVELLFLIASPNTGFTFSKFLFVTAFVAVGHFIHMTVIGRNVTRIYRPGKAWLVVARKHLSQPRVNHVSGSAIFQDVPNKRVGSFEKSWIEKVRRRVEDKTG